MKKVIFLSVIALAAAVSCSKSEVVDTKFESEAIGFETYLGRDAQTKATETTTANLEEFGVYGYYTAGKTYTEAAPATANLMNNVKVTKSGDTWTYSPAKYWTNEVDKYTFFAYAPYSVGSDTSAPVISYTVAPALADQKDVIYSVNNRDVTKTSCTHADGIYVPFEFKHALSRIAVRAKAVMYDKNGAVATDQTTEFDHTFTITDITLQGKFATSGTMDLSAENPSWTSTTAATTYDMTATAGQELTGKDFNFSTDNYLMVLPTDFSAKNEEEVFTNTATLTVKYKITYAGATSDEITKTLPINTNFEQGKAYTINLTLQRNEDNAIIFNVSSVDGWNTENEITVS